MNHLLSIFYKSILSVGHLTSFFPVRPRRWGDIYSVVLLLKKHQVLVEGPIEKKVFGRFVHGAPEHM